MSELGLVAAHADVAPAGIRVFERITPKIPLAFIATFLTASVSQAVPVVTAMRFTPLVVPDSYALAITFEATTTGSPASVAFEYNGVDRAMFDNGTNGDLVSGDGVWTIQFLPGEIIGKLTPAAVYRPFIGFCKPAGGGMYNVFAEVWTSAIGTASVLARSSTVQQTDHVVNIVVTTSQLQTFNSAALTKAFYAVYPDAYDFLNLVSAAGQVANRHHETASNAVSGLGQMVFNNTGTYSSAGRLKGATVFPTPTFYDGASNGFNHETGHQWMMARWIPGVMSPHWPKARRQRHGARRRRRRKAAASTTRSHPTGRAATWSASLRQHVDVVQQQFHLMGDSACGGRDVLRPERPSTPSQVRRSRVATTFDVNTAIANGNRSPTSDTAEDLSDRRPS